MNREQPEDIRQPTEYVNPFVGTAAYGHTFPGAALPFGMVQISPATGAIRDKGYSYSSIPHGRDSETIIGFTHTNVSGTGIGHIVIDITRQRLWPALNDDAFIEIVGDNQIQGYTTVIGHHSRDPMTWYFYAEFSKPFDSFGAFSESTVVERQRSARGNNGVGAYISYSTEDNEEIIAKVGISFTSIEGAKNNLHAEVEGWNFDKVKKTAEDIWNEKLNKINVSGGKLEFEMGPDPNTDWGSSPAAAPPSMSKK